jgi:hypothetical protein
MKLGIVLIAIGMCNVDMQSLGSESKCLRSCFIGSVGYKPWTNWNNRRLPLRLKGGDRVGYDFYGKDAQIIGSLETNMAISRIPEWDSAQVILRPKGHEGWLRINAHQKEVTAMIVIRFEGKEYLISADGFGAMLVWDTETWQCVRELAGHRFRPRVAADPHPHTYISADRAAWPARYHSHPMRSSADAVVAAAAAGRALPRQPGRQVPRRVPRRRRRLQRRRRLRRLGVARARWRGGLARLARRARRRRHVLRRRRAPQP